MEVKAYAKLNLTLDVLGRREDGYHDLCMVMQTITLHDTLYLTPNGSGAVRAASDLSFLPTGEKNLAAAAALTLSLAACSGPAASPMPAGGDTPPAGEPAAVYKVGICNYVDDASLNQIVENIRDRLAAIGEE